MDNNSVLSSFLYKISWFRPVLIPISYFREILVERVTYPSHPPLFLHLKKGRLMLGTADTIYSWDDRYKNFFWTFEQLDLQKWDRPRILLIGFGLGAIPYMLERNFGLSFVMDGVDIHPGALQLAKKHGINRLANPIDLHAEDGIRFMQETNSRYDWIIIDVCIEDVIPTGFEEDQFLENIGRALNPNGVVLYNRFYSSYKDQFLTDRFLQRKFRKHFSSSRLIDFEGTAVLVGEGAKL